MTPAVVVTFFVGMPISSFNVVNLAVIEQCRMLAVVVTFFFVYLPVSMLCIRFFANLLVSALLSLIYFLVYLLLCRYAFIALISPICYLLPLLTDLPPSSFSSPSRCLFSFRYILLAVASFYLLF